MIKYNLELLNADIAANDAYCDALHEKKETWTHSDRQIWNEYYTLIEYRTAIQDYLDAKDTVDTLPERYILNTESHPPVTSGVE
jgi:hypothetical protein